MDINIMSVLLKIIAKIEVCLGHKINKSDTNYEEKNHQNFFSSLQMLKPGLRIRTHQWAPRCSSGLHPSIVKSEVDKALIILTSSLKQSSDQILITPHTPYA